MVIVVNVLMNSLNVLVLDMNTLLSIIIINNYIKCDHNIYSDIRCGLAHSYMIDENAKIVIEGDGDCGIEYDSTTRTYTFIINKYFEDFKIAVNNFINGLESGNEDLSKFKDVIESKPMLI